MKIANSKPTIKIQRSYFAKILVPQNFSEYMIVNTKGLNHFSELRCL